MADRVGQQLGNYHLIRLLGEGGFAEVYLGEHLHLSTQAAIKVLQTQLASDDVERFRSEARTIARLIHPHIVRVLDFGLEGKTPFLVMDYAPHGTLRQRHPKGSRLPLETIVSYVKQVADALQYAHDEKLIHRDIKPENMLLGRRDDILLSDFGIALVAQSSHYQSTQEMAGTMAYMAPEQIQGKPRPASDQYSLGIVVYEWLSGDRPFHGSMTEIVAQHLAVPPPSLREKTPTIPPAVEQVVLTALAKDPKQRFASVQAFAMAFVQACQSTQPVQPSPLAPADTTNASAMPSPLATLAIPSLPHPSVPEVSPQQSQRAFATGAVDHQAAPVAANRIFPPQQTRSTASSASVPQTTAGEEAFSPGASGPPAPTHASPSAPSLQEHAVGAAVQGNVSSRGGFGRRVRQRVWLMALLLILLLVGSGLTLAQPNLMRNITPNLQPLVTVTITPASQVEQNNYGILAVTSTLNAAQRQVGARILTASASQQKTVTATGQAHTPGTQATGTLTFSNGNWTSYTVGAGTVFTDAQGVQVATNVAAVIPSANPSTGVGRVTVSAHAVTAGTAGKIPAYDIDMVPCCGSPNVAVVNTAAFTGGQDPKNYSFLQQSDIDSVATPLKNALLPQAQSSLKSQMRSSEQPATAPQCTPTINVNEPVGDTGVNVSSATVTVTVTCKQEVYDQQGVQTVVSNLLTTKANTDLGSGYALVGSIVASTTAQGVDAKTGTVSLLVNAKGKWVYQFSDAQKQALAKLIAGMNAAQAKAILKNQPGVANVSIPADITMFPTDSTQITITIASSRGFSADGGMPAAGITDVHLVASRRNIS